MLNIRCFLIPKILGFNGAITGTQYENATNDIKVDVLELTSEKGNVIIPLDLTFENPTEAPFPYIQEVAVSEYKIVDSNNKEIVKLKFLQKMEIKELLVPAKY